MENFGGAFGSGDQLLSDTALSTQAMSPVMALFIKKMPSSSIKL